MIVPWRGGVVAGLLAVTTAACSQWPGASLTGPSSTATPAPTPGGSTTPTPTPTPGQGTTVAFNQDIQPILAGDCARCHSQLRTYSGTMAVVQAGNANSRLVAATRSNGAMYRYLTVDRAAKSNLIYQWVVNNKAAQSR